MSLKKKIKVAIISATGYTGLDLVHLLSKHSKVEILNLCATKNLGKKISYFDKRIKKKLPIISSIKKINLSKIDLIFFSLPNGEAQKIIKKIFYKYKNIRFIDLSADFRLSNINTYYKNYKIKHNAPDLINNSIYSVTELSSKYIKKYRIIANPGCYPTSIQIPLIPLLKKRLIKNQYITIDSKSGFSGAGKNIKKKFKHKNLLSSTFAYGINFHRHVCEVDQEILKHTRNKIIYTFTPHLIPTFRGILSSIYVYTKNASANELRSALIKFYKNSKFIKIKKLNSNLGSGNVLNSNNCEISICETKVRNKVLILSAIDNLVKGASGQAVQNMNLMYNFPENLGLK